MARATIHVGDCLATMAAMADASVNCCVTSPPYFGLRDYGHDGQIGLEPTPAEFVAKLVRVFREVRRVLRDDGTLWLNLGDSYAGSGRGGHVGFGSSTLDGRRHNQQQSRDARRVQARGSQLPPGFHAEAARAGAIGRAWVKPPDGLKQKDLIGIPWRVAFALQEDGWYLRQDIIWHKPNPMPESVTDRCTKAHEYIFLLSKSARYHFDAEAIKEPSVTNDPRRPYGSPGANALDPRGKQGDGQLRGSGNKERKQRPNADVLNAGAQAGSVQWAGAETRNRRSVWSVTTKPFKGAHFATFPPDLIEPCVLAGCPQGGTVLDPFMGAGTTALVAVRHGRNAVGCELNPDYAEIARARIAAARAEMPLYAGGDA